MIRRCHGNGLRPQGAFIANLFPVRTRFTGTAMARESNGALVAGLIPMVVAALLEAGNGNIIWPATYMTVCFAVTILAIALAKGRGDNLSAEKLEAERR